MQKLHTKEKRRLRPGQAIILGFLAVILIGTLLLSLPLSTAGGRSASPETAAFTAVSATCVTGLVIEDTMSFWSPFGQMVILLLIQIGGLGFMTMAILLSMLVRRTITPQERIIAAQSLNLNRFGGMVRLIRRTLLGTFLFEAAGAAMLATQFIPVFGVGDGLFKSLFHSVSAFCNAGFDLMGNYSGRFSSMTAFADNYVVNFTLILLIVSGGIGFVVWNEIIERLRHRQRLSVYSRLVLLMTVILLLGGTVLFLLLEWSNPGTLGQLPADKKLLAALFQSATARTAGFCTIDNAALTDPSKLITVLLMFIGGASGSTAGGVKVGTVGLLFYAAFAAARGGGEINLFRRRIPVTNVLRALSLTVISLSVNLFATVLLSIMEHTSFMTAMYEAFSAAATVGLSLGFTPAVSTAGHILLMLLMFFGRVGILTIACSITVRMAHEKEAFSYPDAQMLIG